MQLYCCVVLLQLKVQAQSNADDILINVCFAAKPELKLRVNTRQSDVSSFNCRRSMDKRQ